MPFQMRDETAAQNILYIDDAGQLGLGSLPNGGQAITVQGTSFISTSGAFGDNTFQPGAQAGYEGQVFVPGNGTAAVLVSTAQPPTVSTGLPATSVSTTQVVFTNAGGATTNTYSIW